MKTLLVWYEWSGFAVQIKNHIIDALDELQIEYKECYIEQLGEVSNSFTPTMTIHFHPDKKIYDYLGLIDQTKGHKLLWQMEDPYESDLTFDALLHFYYIFTSDENTADQLKKENKGNNIQFVPHACNPKVHRPEEVSWEYKSDICFIGNAYESRLKFLQDHAEEYKSKLFRLVGVGYRGLDGYQNQHIIHGHINEETMVRYINGTKFALNLHRQNSDLDMANNRNIQPKGMNNRFYEIWACGKTQLVWGRGENFTWDRDYKEAHKDHSYKQRLIEHYLPLLKGIGK